MVVVRGEVGWGGGWEWGGGALGDMPFAGHAPPPRISILGSAHSALARDHACLGPRAGGAGVAGVTGLAGVAGGQQADEPGRRHAEALTHAIKVLNLLALLVQKYKY